MAFGRKKRTNGHEGAPVTVASPPPPAPTAEPESPGGGNGRKRRRAGVVTLRAVGVSEDGKSVLLGRPGAKTGSFKVPIDAALVDQLEAAARIRTAPPPPVEAETPPGEAKSPRQLIRPSSKLTIKEIQHFLRQGKAPAWIAKKAGVAIEWVQRFEGPIVWERVGMARRARQATMARSRKGPSKLVLEDAVRSNLRARGLPVPPEGSDDGWDSVRRPKKRRWVVSYTFKSRGHAREAQWEFDPDTQKITPLNDLAAELGWARK